MSSVMIGDAPVRECKRCEGLWLDTKVFQLICADREHSIALGDALTAAGHHASTTQDEQVRYIPCPHCRQLMNRINFANCSGVVVDVCKQHGTWFDHDELRQIVEFIRGGGMELSRENVRHELELQKEKLRTEAATISYRSTSITYSLDDERLGGLSAARGLLKFLQD
jgi:Zn-finger nucleic acid-binding protein